VCVLLTLLAAARDGPDGRSYCSSWQLAGTCGRDKFGPPTTYWPDRSSWSESTTPSIPNSKNLGESKHLKFDQIYMIR
jgi:hypothetical protein